MTIVAYDHFYAQIQLILNEMHSRIKVCCIVWPVCQIMFVSVFFFRAENDGKVMCACKLHK